MFDAYEQMPKAGQMPEAARLRCSPREYTFMDASIRPFRWQQRQSPLSWPVEDVVREVFSTVGQWADV